MPCKEDDIRDVQSQLEIPYDTDTRVYIDGVDSNAPELCILEGQNGNLDFMNLLGRVMYGMDCGEFEQFRAGLFVEEGGAGMPNGGIGTLVLVALIMLVVLGGVSVLAHIYNLNNIKSKTVGDGQHGTARWARKEEIRKTYKHIPYEPELWRKGEHLPKPDDQGIVVGCEGKGSATTALVDTNDVHALMIGAAGVGKTAYFLYPNLEYACASGMSFVTSDTKGDLYRHYGKIAKEYYGYNVAVIDLRNPTKSDGNNLLHLVNKYMDLWKENPDNLSYKAKAEKYAKIIAKTIILSGMDGSSFGQNAFFYDAAEGLLCASILLVAEFCPKESRHIVSVFKIIQDLLAPSSVMGNLSLFQSIHLGLRATQMRNLPRS